MKVVCREEGKQITIFLQGDLDHHAARHVMGEIGRAIDTRLPVHCVLDMQNVDFMDSSGIAVVLGAHRRMKEIGGKLEVFRVPAQAKRVFSAAGIERIVQMIQV